MGIPVTSIVWLSISPFASILERDLYYCRSCGKNNLEANLAIDHIIPLARGGQNDISNLQTLCFTCNQRKSDRLDRRFRRFFDT